MVARSTVAVTPAARTRRTSRKAPPPPPPPKRSPWRHWKWWSAGTVVVVALLVTRLFFVPASDEPTTADAVVVFDGAAAGPLTGALALMNRQVAPVLVLPGGLDAGWPAANRLCGGATPFEVLCPAANAGSERAVARLTGQLVEQRGWHRVVIVTPTQSLSRATLLTKRCTPAELVRVGAGGPGGAGNAALQGAGEALRYLDALVTRGC